MVTQRQNSAYRALLVHLDKIAIILGCAWTVAGIIYLLILTKGLKEEPPELGIDA